MRRENMKGRGGKEKREEGGTTKHNNLYKYKPTSYGGENNYFPVE
jgi:hypothetical protein